MSRRLEMLAAAAMRRGAWIFAAADCYDEGRAYTIISNRQLESKAERAKAGRL